MLCFARVRSLPRAGTCLFVCCLRSLGTSIGLAKSIQAIRFGEVLQSLFAYLNHPRHSDSHNWAGNNLKREGFLRQTPQLPLRLSMSWGGEMALALQGREGKWTEACEWQIALNKETNLPSYQQLHQKLTWFSSWLGQIVQPYMTNHLLSRLVCVIQVWAKCLVPVGGWSSLEPLRQALRRRKGCCLSSWHSYWLKHWLSTPLPCLC